MMRFLLILPLLLMMTAPLRAAEEPPEAAHSLDELLELVKQGKAAEAKADQLREQRFLRDRDKQKALLAEAEAERDAEEKRSTRLEAAFAANDQKLAGLQKELDSELGSMKELFGILQYAAIDTRKTLDQSVVSAEIPNRDGKLVALSGNMATASRLPAISDIEALWYEMLREMTEAGRITTFREAVMRPDGSRKERELLRVGAFALTSGDNFIQYMPETGTLERMARQPSQSFRDAAAKFQSSAPGTIVAYPVDPTGGELLKRLVQQPSVRERIDRGGFISYLILGLGLFSLVLIGERAFYLTAAGRKLRAQMRSEVALDDNPLGRILTVYENNRTANVDVLEFKLDEAILRELPQFERSITIIRVISLAAPLFGLLGTVVGMIQTFQAMALFETGDPRILAGGVAQALMTTVLGLVVAIPTLFAHNIVSSMSRRIVQVLREQSAGIVAVHAEREHK